MRFLNTSGRDASAYTRPPKRGIWLIIVVVAFSIGFLCFTVTPSVALYNGQITGDQYVEITSKFYEFGYKVVEYGASIIPSIIPGK